MSGAGVDRPGVERRVLDRADRRRRRRRVGGGLVAGAFLVLVIGGAVALSGTRSTRTLGPPDDFTAFCAVAKKMKPNGADETGRTPDQRFADTLQRVNDLKRAAPAGLQGAFGTVLAGGIPTTDQPTSEQRQAALKEIDGALRTHCHTTIRILGGSVQATESRSSSSSESSSGTGQSDSCLSSQPFRICLVRKDGLVGIEASGLQPGSVVRAQMVTATLPWAGAGSS